MKDRTKDILFWLGIGVGGCFAARALLRRARAMDLRGRVALITGGSRGLGLVLARQLAREGMRLAICARDSDRRELLPPQSFAGLFEECADFVGRFDGDSETEALLQQRKS